MVLIQALKADPQMVKLIHNISRANDGGQHEDNDNNITKYLKSNNSLLNLA